MFWEIYAILSIVTHSLLFLVIIRGVYNFFRFRAKYDFLLMLFLVFLVVPVILDLMRAVWLLVLPLGNWDFLIVWYGISILSTFVGIGLLIKLLFVYAGLMKTEIKYYWKLGIIAIFGFLSVTTYFALTSPEFLVLHEDLFTYRTVLVIDSGYNALFLILIEIISFPFVLKFLKIGRKMHTPRWRKRAFEATIFVELLYLIIYMQIGLIINWETVIINSILEFILVIFVLFIFLPRNQGEAMFMQVRLESIYICEKSGRTLYTNFFKEGKNRDQHGKLVWGLVESTTNMINKIRGVKHVGLGHILLDDGTAIIIETSEKAPLYYIVFTARYSDFTHEQVKNIKRVLDNQYAVGISNVNPQVLDKVIHDIFFV